MAVCLLLMQEELLLGYTIYPKNSKLFFYEEIQSKERDIWIEEKKILLLFYENLANTHTHMQFSCLIS